MKTVHKYTIPAGNGSASFTSHRGARALHVAEQHGQICLWVEVDPNEWDEAFFVQVVPTGGQVPDFSAYLGTALLASGDFVFHVYHVQLMGQG